MEQNSVRDRLRKMKEDGDRIARGGTVSAPASAAKRGPTQSAAGSGGTGASVRERLAKMRSDGEIIARQRAERSSPLMATDAQGRKVTGATQRDAGAARRTFAAKHPEVTGGEVGGARRAMNSEKVYLEQAREELKKVQAEKHQVRSRPTDRRKLGLSAPEPKRETAEDGAVTAGMPRRMARELHLNEKAERAAQAPVRAAKERVTEAKERAMDAEKAYHAAVAQREWDALPSDPEELLALEDAEKEKISLARAEMSRLTNGGRVNPDRLSGDMQAAYRRQVEIGKRAEARLNQLAQKQHEARNLTAFGRMAKEPQAAAGYAGAEAAKRDEEALDQVLRFLSDPGSVPVEKAQGVLEDKARLMKKYGLTEEDFTAYVGGDPAAIQAVYDQLKAKIDQSAEAMGEGYDFEDMYRYTQRLQRQQERQATNQETARFAEDHPVAASAASILASPLQALDVLSMDWGQGKPGDPNYIPPDTSRMGASSLVNTVRGTVSQEIEANTDWELFGQNVGSFLYQTGMSMGDSALAVSTLGPGSVYLMGTNAAVNGAKDIVERGGTAEQALWGGLAAGAAEVVFEKVSVDNLLKPKTGAGLRYYLKETLKQGGIEASEETLTEIANILSDAAVMGANSNWDQAVAAYEAQGLSREEAKRRAYLDCVAQVAWAGAGGFVSGVGMGGGKLGMDYVGQRVNQTITDTQKTASTGEAGSTAINTDPETHTPAQMKTINEYRDAVDTSILNFIKRWRGLKDQSYRKKVRMDIAPVDQRTIEDVQAATGIDVSDFTGHSLSGNALEHIDLRHGATGEADHSMADLNDIARMGYVLEHYDSVEPLIDKHGKPVLSGEYYNADGSRAPEVRFQMRVNGTYYVVEAVPDAAVRKFRVVSAYMEGSDGTGQELNMPQSGPQPTSKTQLDAHTIASISTVAQPAEDVNLEDDGVTQRELELLRGLAELDAQQVARGAEGLGAQGQATMKAMFLEGQDAESYVRGMKELYAAGLSGADMETAASSDAAAGLNAHQQRAAYTAGQLDAAAANSQAPARGTPDPYGGEAADGSAALGNLEEEGQSEGAEPEYPFYVTREEAEKAKTAEGKTVPVVDARPGWDTADSYTRNWKEGHADQKMVQRMDTLAQRLGVRLQIVPEGGIRVAGTGQTANADYSGSVIRMEANNPNPEMFLLSHEFTHRLQDLDSESYNVFRDYVAGLEGTEADVADMMALYAGVKGYTQEMALDEVTANYAGRMLEDGALLDRFIAQHSQTKPSLIRRFLDWLRGVKDRLTGTQRANAAEAEAKLMAALEAGSQRAVELTEEQNAKTAEQAQEGADTEAQTRHSVKGSERVGETHREAEVQEEITRQYQSTVDAVLRGDYGKSEAVVMGYTPEVYRALGMPSLPFVIGPGHVYSIVKTTGEAKADGRYSQNTNYHGLGEQVVKTLYDKATKPVMVIAAKDEAGNKVRSRSKRSVVAIVDVGTEGKSLLLPIEITAERTVNGQQMDVNVLSSAYKRSTSELVREAIAQENVGQVGVYYITEEAKTLLADGVQFPKRLTEALASTGIVHSIPENVNLKIMDQTQSLQFKRWFGDWQNDPEHASKVVDAEGKPLVVYHGTDAEFDTFHSKDGTFWFSAEADYAEEMAHERGGTRIVQAYLDMKNPYYATLEPGRFTDPTFENPIIQAARDGGHDGVILRADTDNELLADTFYIVFEPTQIKSATDNIGTFDGTNPDIRYSIKGSERVGERTYQEMIGEYGAIKPGESPAREVAVPRRTSKDKKVSQTVRTILEAEVTPEVAIPTLEELTASGEFSYEVYTDKAAMKDAEIKLKRKGWDNTLAEWKADVAKGVVSKENTSMGWLLYNNAVNEGNVQTALDILNLMVKHQRNAAQAVQATRILKKMSPEAQLYNVQRSVWDLQEELNKRYGDKKSPKLKIPEELAEDFLEAGTQDEREQVLHEIGRAIGRQVPSTLGDKWNAWRYLAMLGNPRTHIRNTVGNAGFMPVVAVKDMTATAIEAVVGRVSGGRLERTKGAVGLGKGDRALLKAAWGDYASVRAQALGEGKYSDRAMMDKDVEAGRRIFKSRVLEGARRGNSAMLDLEDAWFSQPHYAYALAQFCKANGITAEELAEASEGLQADGAYDTMSETEYLLKEGATNDGEAQAWDARVHKSTGEGYQVHRSVKAVYTYRRVQSVQGLALSERFRAWGIKSDIVDGFVLSDENGITIRHDVQVALTAPDGTVLINKNISTAELDDALGHEVMHVWKHTAARKRFCGAIRDNVDYGSQAFRNYQQRIVDAYFGGELDLTDEAQVDKFEEEFFAYIGGQLNDGGFEDLLRPMLLDYDAAKAAWDALVWENTRGEARREVDGAQAAEELLAKARAYAVREAQKATYRDTNAFSQWVSSLGRPGKDANMVKRAMGVAMEGVLPFRKTPANILMRGVEYSPIGLVKSLSWDMAQVARGKMTGAETIDHISAGLTGTGLMLLGVFLAAQGLVRGDGGDEKKKEFEELQGHQDYALEVGGSSVTLDWLAPEALPFFIGVNLYEQTQGDWEETKMEDVLAAAGSVTEPLLEMSCLQSLNDLVETVQYGDDHGIVPIAASIATSYLTQALPTILGQVERSGEGERMTTYTDRNKFLTTDMQYTIGRASARVPGLDYAQIPYIDAWGRAEDTGSLPERIVKNFLNPAYTDRIDSSAMEDELMRLYEATGDDGVFPSRMTKYFNVDGKRKDLTAEEYVTYATVAGKEARRLVVELTASRQYEELDDAERVVAIRFVYQKAKKTGQGAVAEVDEESWMTKAREAKRKYNIDEGTYISLKVTTSGIESLKDKDGETIANSKGLQIMEAVYDMPGLSDRQRQAMFEYLGVGKTVRHYNKAKVAEDLRKMRKGR